MKDTQGMKIKSYFAKSMDEAINKARVELGSDALLLNTRRIPDSGSGAGYEVVMGVAGGTTNREVSAPIREVPAPAREIPRAVTEATEPARATLRVTPAP